MSDYSDKLKDPKWQKKRLEVMERAEFTCEECGDKENTLNVHHGYYKWGNEPWEYANETLKCLCEDCHKKYQVVLSDIKEAISHLKLGELEGLRRFIAGTRVRTGDKSVTTPIGDPDTSYGFSFGFCNAFLVEPVCGGTPPWKKDRTSCYLLRVLQQFNSQMFNISYEDIEEAITAADLDDSIGVHVATSFGEGKNKVISIYAGLGMAPWSMERQP